MRRKLLLATTNRGKAREYKSLFKDIPFELVTLDEEGITNIVDEVGANLEENAILKAKTLALETSLLSLADDSGLEVDVLGGEPGNLSARYAGEGASDRERIDFLLSRMQNVPWPERSARFKCIIAIATPAGEVEVCSGVCEGLITLEPKGKHGFTYDPIFYLPELDKTMAELPMEIKNQVSHRGQAARKARQLLRKHFSNC